jgi:integrase
MSLRKRGHNYWEIRISEGTDPTTGKRILIFHSFRGTQREANSEHARLLRARDLGMSIKPSKLTVAEYLDQWIADYARLRVSTRTLDGYKDMIRLHVSPKLGAILLQKLRPVHLQSFYSDQLDNGRIIREKKKVKEGKEAATSTPDTPEKKVDRSLSPQTVVHFHRVLHEALGTAVKWGLLAVNPADAVTPPRVTRKEPTVLTEEQTLALLEASKGTRLHMPILLAVSTGMRRGEILALRWSDCDLKEGQIYVRAVSQTSAGITFKEPKSRTSRRALALPQFAVVALKEHRKAQSAYRLELGPGYQDTGLVVPAADGSTWAPSLFTAAFCDFVRKVKLPRIRFHDLRHGHVTQLLLAGVPLKVVSARAGHSGIAITADLYGHVLPGADEQAAKKLNDALFPGAGRGKRKAKSG